MPRLKLVLCCLICAAAWSREFSSSITGAVVDAQGAVVPNTKITAVLITTGGRSETTSGPDGLYTIPFLIPGIYRVEAQAPGFKHYVRERVEASTGERIGLDIRLDVGDIT